ncbi:hypothetical protein ACLOJK_018790 [Asimina triloba]
MTSTEFLPSIIVHRPTSTSSAEHQTASVLGEQIPKSLDPISLPLGQQHVVHWISKLPAADRTFDGDDAIPSLRESFSKFLTMYPKFQSSEQID